MTESRLRCKICSKLIYYGEEINYGQLRSGGLISYGFVHKECLDNYSGEIVYVDEDDLSINPPQVKAGFNRGKYGI